MEFVCLLFFYFLYACIGSFSFQSEEKYSFFLALCIDQEDFRFWCFFSKSKRNISVWGNLTKSFSETQQEIINFVWKSGGNAAHIWIAHIDSTSRHRPFTRGKRDTCQIINTCLWKQTVTKLESDVSDLWTHTCTRDRVDWISCRHIACVHYAH